MILSDLLFSGLKRPMDSHNDTRCRAIKGNGKQCRQRNKPKQTGGAIIDGYCKYHADQRESLHCVWCDYSIAAKDFMKIGRVMFNYGDPSNPWECEKCVNPTRWRERGGDALTPADFKARNTMRPPPVDTPPLSLTE